MRRTVTVLETAPFYNYEPNFPKEGDLWAEEEKDYLRVFVYIDKEWHDVLDMTHTDKGVVIVFDDIDSEISEDIDNLDYRYRIGAL